MKLNKDKIMLMLARQERTIADLANDYGATRHRLYALLNSEKVNTATAGKLARALGVDVTEILA